MQFLKVHQSDLEALIELRIRAMQPSLEAVGRFDPIRARERFAGSFNAQNTFKIVLEDQLIGFYVLINKEDHLWLDHLYIDPPYQGGGKGSKIIKHIQHIASDQKRPLKLGALKQSPANRFYSQQGFEHIETKEWDNIYQWQPQT